MEMGRTCCKASPQQMGAGNKYVGPLHRQDKQREAKYQRGTLLVFQETGPEWRVIEISGKCWDTR